MSLGSLAVAGLALPAGLGSAAASGGSGGIFLATLQGGRGFYLGNAVFVAFVMGCYG